MTGETTILVSARSSGLGFDRAPCFWAVVFIIVLSRVSALKSWEPFTNHAVEKSTFDKMYLMVKSYHSSTFGQTSI
jgi:hypothetical protein